MLQLFWSTRPLGAQIEEWGQFGNMCLDVMSSLNVFFSHKTTISFSLVASKLILVMMHKPSKTNVSHTAYSIIQLALKSPEKITDWHAVILWDQQDITGLTVLIQLNAVAFIKFCVIQVLRLFEGRVYTRVAFI